MGLTVAAGDTFATFITGESVGAVGQSALLFAFGRGSSGVSSVLQLKNGDTGGGATPKGEDVFAKGADAQNAFVVQSTLPT